MIAIGRGGELGLGGGLELADVTFGPGASAGDAMGLGVGVRGLTPFLDA